jgi:uncharacterized protein (DUF1499 family)
MYHQRVRRVFRLPRKAERAVRFGLLDQGFLLLLFLVFMLAQCSEGRPEVLGVTDGKFSDCPNSPNCVSSQSSDKRHFIEPFRYQGALGEARSRLVAILDSMARAKMVTVQEDYIHAEFRSRLFGFVDDVEFYLDEDRRTIHLRSASRTGYYDFGVNRKRMERIRDGFLTGKTHQERQKSSANVNSTSDD